MHPATNRTTSAKQLQSFSQSKHFFHSSMFQGQTWSEKNITPFVVATNTPSMTGWSKMVLSTHIRLVIYTGTVYKIKIKGPLIYSNHSYLLLASSSFEDEEKPLSFLVNAETTHQTHMGDDCNPKRSVSSWVVFLRLSTVLFCVLWAVLTSTKMGSISDSGSIKSPNFQLSWFHNYDLNCQNTSSYDCSTTLSGKLSCFRYLIAWHHRLV